MNRLYLDSGALVKLYVIEPGSEEVQAAIQGIARLDLNRLQEAEVRNALLAAAGRGTIEEKAAERAMGFIDEDLRLGRLIHRDVSWSPVWARTLELAAQHTQAILCRTLDILHVSIAMEQEASAMVTGDRRQATLCERVGLSVIWISGDA